MFETIQTNLRLLAVAALAGIALLATFLAASREVKAAVATSTDAQSREKELATKKNALQRRGLIVIVGLALLTAVEYVIAIAAPGGVALLLGVIALIKAGLILYYFMHVAQIWRTDEEHA
jgi:cytochrome c oxidase subunit 4